MARDDLLPRRPARLEWRYLWRFLARCAGFPPRSGETP